MLDHCLGVDSTDASAPQWSGRLFSIVDVVPQASTPPGVNAWIQWFICSTWQALHMASLSLFLATLYTVSQFEKFRAYVGTMDTFGQCLAFLGKIWKPTEAACHACKRPFQRVWLGEQLNSDFKADYPVQTRSCVWFGVRGFAGVS